MKIKVGEEDDHRVPLVGVSACRVSECIREATVNEKYVQEFSLSYPLDLHYQHSSREEEHVESLLLLFLYGMY